MNGMKNKDLDNDIVPTDREIQDELIAQFLTKCNYVKNYAVLSNLKNPAREAAKLCKEMGVDPETYVDAHIRYTQPLRGYSNMIPQQLYNKQSKIYVEDFIRLKGDRDIDAEFKTQCRLFGRCLNGGWSEHLCLLNPTFDFYPWFRILISAVRYDDVIAEYGYLAAQILNNDPELVKYLSKIRGDGDARFDFGRIPGYKHE